MAEESPREPRPSPTISWPALGVVTAMVINLASMSYGYGKLVAKLESLEKRFDKFEARREREEYETRKNLQIGGFKAFIGPSEATADTIGEAHERSRKSSTYVHRKESP